MYMLPSRIALGILMNITLWDHYQFHPNCHFQNHFLTWIFHIHITSNTTMTSHHCCTMCHHQLSSLHSI